MKKIAILCGVLLLTACQMVGPKQYIANMYANGTLDGYETTGGCMANEKVCPGCHVKNFDRALLTVTEVWDENAMEPVVTACRVSVVDSLGLLNVSDSRYIPASELTTCDIVYEKEKAYLKAMGFSE